MSSSTTEQHRDDLAARRRRKQARESGARTDDAATALQGSEAARGLLRDLITGTQDPSPAEGNPVKSELDARARDTGLPDSSPSPGSAARATTSGDGERVDELVRRVRAGTSAAAAEALATVGRGRPKGTADLAADAAGKDHPRGLATMRWQRRSGTRAVGSRRWVAVVCLLAAGSAVLALAATRSGSGVPQRAADLAATRAERSQVPAFAGALGTTIATIGPALTAASVVTTAPAPRPRQQRAANRQREPSGQGAGAARDRRVSRGQLHSVSQSSATLGARSDTQTVATSAASTSQVHSYTPSTAAESSDSTAASHTSSTTSASHAGPTGSNPLGGIGSCVKGC
jgi:hypothetical protein